MHEAKTFCRICEAACGLSVEHGADGSIELKPDRAHPHSRGYVCAKGTRFTEVASHPDRILRPRLRSGSCWNDASWEEALALVAERARPIIERYGPHAVAVYAGNPLAFNALGQITSALFAQALGTRNVFSAGSQDCNNKFAGGRLMHGSEVIQPIPDFEHTELAVLFGTNPAVSQSSFVHLPEGALAFDRLRERGGRLIWVDVRRTESAKRGGELILVRPGTDVWLLLALLGLLARDAHDDARTEGLDRLIALAREIAPERAASVTGVSAEQIRELAQAISRARSCVLHMSVGVNQGPFGTLSYVLLQAIALVTGNYDARGGSLFSPLAVRAARLLKAAGVFEHKAQSRIGGLRAVLDALPGAVLADEILTEGPERVRALIVIAGDPLRSIPGAARLRAAFERLDLLVSIDLFENLTGRYAHAILPARSWLERADLALPGLVLQTSPLLQTTRAMLPAPGETRPEAAILADLSLALGRPLFGSRLAAQLVSRAPLDRLLETLIPWAQRFADPQGKLQGYGLPITVPEAGTYLGRGPVTPGHRVRFWDPSFEAEVTRLREWEAKLRGRSGLVLIGRRRRLGHNAWLHGGTHAGKPESEAWMATQDMLRMNISDGARVQVRTESGEIELPARAKPDVQPGTVVVPHGELGMNVNELIPAGVAHVEPLSGQLLMTGIPVEVELAHAFAGATPSS